MSCNYDYKSQERLCHSIITLQHVTDFISHTYDYKRDCDYITQL